MNVTIFIYRFFNELKRKIKDAQVEKIKKRGK
jgi:hypothetical protein